MNKYRIRRQHDAPWITDLLATIPRAEAEAIAALLDDQHEAQRLWWYMRFGDSMGQIWLDGRVVPGGPRLNLEAEIAQHYPHLKHQAACAKEVEQ